MPLMSKKTKKIELMGVDISAGSKTQILNEIAERFDSGKKTFIVTPYSEFFVYAAKDFHFKKALSKADLSLPDGISTLWLSYYLSLPFSTKGYFAKIWQGFWQMFFSLFKIVFWPSTIRKAIPEKISGASFFWDLVNFADKKKLKIFLLGGFGETPKIAASKILEKFSNVEVGFSNRDPN